jgi:hypothetical protein
VKKDYFSIQRENPLDQEIKPTEINRTIKTREE